MATESQQQILANDGDEISLRDLILKVREWWRYLLSKWMIILLFGLVGGALGFVYANFKKPVYTATTTFVLDDEKSNGLGSLAGLASVAGINIGGGGGGIFEGDNILGLYKSRTMLQKTLLTPIKFDGRNQLLVDRYINFNELRKQWANKPLLANLQFSEDSIKTGNQFSDQARLKDSVLGVIVMDLNKNYLTVAKPDKELNTIEVDVKSGDEIFAKTFNDELVKNVNEFYITTKTKKNLQNVTILQHKTDSVRAVMNGAIYSAAAVSDATPNLNPTRQVQRVAPIQRSQFNAETNKTILGSLVQNLEMTKMSLLKETPLIQVIDNPIYPLKEEKLGRLKGIVLGGILFGFFTVLFLLVKRFFSELMYS